MPVNQPAKVLVQIDNNVFTSSTGFGTASHRINLVESTLPGRAYVHLSVFVFAVEIKKLE